MEAVQTALSFSIKYGCFSNVMCSSQAGTAVYSFLSQSQQPLEDLDAKLRRTLSPETVPVTSAPACVRLHCWQFSSLEKLQCFLKVML